MLDANDSSMSGAQEEMAAAAAAAAATAQNSYLDASSAALGLQDRAKTALFGSFRFNFYFNKYSNDFFGFCCLII